MCGDCKKHAAQLTEGFLIDLEKKRNDAKKILKNFVE
jgi:hypothetical protein